MQPILVSVIVPVLNMDAYLDRFLSEFRLQTFFQFTELVVDLNRPSAEALLIVEKYKRLYKKQLVVHTQSEIDPIAISMNRAILKSKGRYIAIWNADDLRTPDSLEQQYKFLSSKGEYVAVGGPYVIVKKFGDAIGRLVDDSGVAESELLRGMFLGPFVMFDSKALSEVGLFDEQLKSGADFDLAIRLARNGRVGFVSDVLGYYLDAGLGASTRPNSLQAIERSVIELRYGIFDKFDHEFIPKITKYDVAGLYFNGKRNLVQDCFHDYHDYYEKMTDLYWRRTTNFSISRQASFAVSGIADFVRRGYSHLKNLVRSEDHR
jgi:glycosyltransferase involved in cell wall biosynthesis